MLLFHGRRGLLALIIVVVSDLRNRKAEFPSWPRRDQSSAQSPESPSYRTGHERSPCSFAVLHNAPLDRIHQAEYTSGERVQNTFMQGQLAETTNSPLSGSPHSLILS